jgi:GT2 family glycosyltransferase
MTTLTISIVTANNKELILDCLRSIYRTIEDLAIEVYVVINASADDSEETIRREFPNVKLIVNQDKLGFTNNHNMVMRRAKGKYILVLNDDTIILKEALLKMVDFMEHAPETGIIGSKLLNPDGSLQWSCGWSINYKVEMFKVGVLRSLLPFIKDKHYGHTREVLWVSGACLMVRKEVVRRVGLFDENFIIYFEDGDLCMRVNQAGWKVVFFPQAEIIHYVGMTRRQFLARDMYVIYKSRLYFFSKHCGFLMQYLIRMVTIFEGSLRFLKTLIEYPSQAKERQELMDAYMRVIRLALSSNSSNRQKP